MVIKALEKENKIKNRPSRFLASKNSFYTHTHTCSQAEVPRIFVYEGEYQNSHFYFHLLNRLWVLKMNKK
jgi:hypothetical protein